MGCRCAERSEALRRVFSSAESNTTTVPEELKFIAKSGVEDLVTTIRDRTVAVRARLTAARR